MRKIVVALLALTGFAVAAGDPPGFAVFKAADLAAIEQQLVQQVGAQKSTSHSFNDFGTHLMSMSHMETDGMAEIHETMNDIFIVRSGEVTLTVGGTVVGAKSTGPGEIRGTSIEGGVTRTIAAGDIVNIPPNTPHWSRMGAGGKATYFVIKVKAK
jgi:mannose-6-phosphate isomerase-like protein (cupin superfamily)